MFQMWLHHEQMLKPTLGLHQHERFLYFFCRRGPA